MVFLTLAVASGKGYISTQYINCRCLFRMFWSKIYWIGCVGQRYILDRMCWTGMCWTQNVLDLGCFGLRMFWLSDVLAFGCFGPRIFLFRVHCFLLLLLLILLLFLFSPAQAFQQRRADLFLCRFVSSSFHWGFSWPIISNALSDPRW